MYAHLGGLYVHIYYIIGLNLWDLIGKTSTLVVIIFSLCICTCAFRVASNKGEVSPQKEIKTGDETKINH